MGSDTKQMNRDEVIDFIMAKSKIEAGKPSVLFLGFENGLVKITYLRMIWFDQHEIDNVSLGYETPIKQVVYLGAAYYSIAIMYGNTDEEMRANVGKGIDKIVNAYFAYLTAQANIYAESMGAMVPMVNVSQFL